MNKLNITYKRVKQVTAPPHLALNGVECPGIDVIVNGELRFSILKEEYGFITFNMDGTYFCGGDDCLLRDNKQSIEYVLNKEAAEAKTWLRFTAEEDAAEAMASQIDETREAVEQACRDNVCGEFTSSNPSDLVYLIDKLRGELLQQDHMTAIDECEDHKILYDAVNRLRAANDELKAVERILSKVCFDTLTKSV